MEKEVGLARRTAVDVERSAGIQSRGRWRTVGLIGCIALLVSACIAPIQQQQRQQHPQRPQRTPAPRLPPAMISFFGDEPELKLTSVDGVPWDQIPEASVFRDQKNAPTGRFSTIGVWLAPGMHTVHAQFVRNIEGGISFVQGDLKVRALSGHTYMVHPTMTTDRGKVSFTVIDYGTAFPMECLPGALSNAKQVGRATRQISFTRDEITACMVAARKKR